MEIIRTAGENAAVLTREFTKHSMSMPGLGMWLKLQCNAKGFICKTTLFNYLCHVRVNAGMCLCATK